MPDAPEPARVVGAILVEDATRLESSLASVRSQSLAPVMEVAVGGGTAGRRGAEALGVVWAPTVDELEIPDDISHIWFVRADVAARPDALEALVRDGGSVEATVAGSKVLAGDDRERLISIGGSTDPLCVPVPLLEVGELDQGQYDVIRDVAYIPSQSILIRRDAFRGLGGIDRLLAPDAAGIDFSQRARVAGGRVVVVPASEVFSEEAFAAGLPSWREQAGQLRALLKSYSWVSLIWALPFWLLVAGLGAVTEALLGRPAALVDPLRSLAWNAKHLGSLLRARRRVGAARQLGDEELFRFQVGGSARIVALWSEVVEILRRPVESGQEAVARVEQSGLGEQAMVGVVGSALWFFAVRSVLGGGLPDGTWTGPLGDATDILASFAGGWNPSGMGGDGPPHPAAALLALPAWVFGSGSVGWVVAAALGLGAVGGYRLASSLGLGRWPALMAGLLTVLGPVTLASGTEGGYPLLVAVSAAPWVAYFVAAPIPSTVRARLGRLARLVVATGVLAMAAPLGLALPLVVALGVVVVVGRTGGLLLALSAMVLALPFLGPWALWYDPMTLLGPTARPWVPAAWFLVAVAVAWLPMLAAGAKWQASALGGLLVGVGAVLARGLVPGREAWLVGLVAVALGVGLVSGGAFDRLLRPGRLRVLALPAVAGTLVLAISIVAAAVSGRVGIDRPDDAGDLITYLAARGDGTQERAVLSNVPFPGAPTGASERFDRVLVPFEWGFEAAWVGPGGSADRALAATVDSIVVTPVARPGAALATHGVRWLVTPPGSALDAALSGRLDVVRLITPEGVVFEGIARAPVAVNSRGAPWRMGAQEAAGPGGLTVRAAINPTVRYDAVIADGSVAFPGSAGSAVVTPDPVLRLVARVALAWGGVVVGLAIWGRRHTR